MTDWGTQLKRKLEAEGKIPSKPRPQRRTLAEAVLDNRIEALRRSVDSVMLEPVFCARVLVAPRTKKNHSRVVGAKRGRPRVLPSEAFEEFERNSLPYLRAMRGGAAPIDFAVNARVVFWRDARRGDAVGYYQAIADVLEKAEVLVDDKWIVSWDGSRLEVDREEPRLEITLERVR